MKLQEKDERQVYLDYLVNVYTRKYYDKKYSPDQRPDAPTDDGSARKPEYADGSQEALEQKYLGCYLPVYDPESGNWCVQTGHGFEYGPLDYVAAEFSGTGLIYHFKRNGQEDHVHSFEAVLACLLDARGILEEMHEDMKSRWNRKITNGDRVYILGDVSLRGRQEELIALVSTLKGHKILIRGNHDDTTDLRYQNLCTSRMGSRFEPTTWAVCCRIWITNLGHLQRS